VNGLGESEDIVLEGGSSGGDHDVDAHVLSEGLADLGGLESKLSGRNEEESLDLGDLDVDLFEGRDDEGGGLSGSVLGLVKGKRGERRRVRDVCLRERERAGQREEGWKRREEDELERGYLVPSERRGWPPPE